MFYCVKMKKVSSLLRVLVFCVCLFFIIKIVLANFVFIKPYSETVKKNCEQYSLEENFVYAVMFVESRFDSNALSHKGAKGLMQITDGTGAWGAENIEIIDFKEEDLFDPQINIKIGCWYLARLKNQYDGVLKTALAAYNAGSGNVAKWQSEERYSLDGITLDEIPFEETKKYVKKVKLVKLIYDFLY